MSHQPPAKSQLPSYLQRYFWEYDPQALDIHKHANVIMARVMERGTWQAMLWLREKYSVEEICSFLYSKGWKVLPPRELNYWALVGRIPEQERKELLKKVRETDSTWRDRIAD